MIVRQHAVLVVLEKLWDNALLTNIQSQQRFISKVSVWWSLDNLKATKLCIWRKGITVKDLQTAPQAIDSLAGKIVC